MTDGKRAITRTDPGSTTASALQPFGDSALATRTRAHDWSATPLGPIDAWPQSLRTVVDVMLGSRFSMRMAWGPGELANATAPDGPWLAPLRTLDASRRALGRRREERDSATTSRLS